MVDIQAQEGQSAQDVNWSTTAMQEQEGMGVKSNRQHDQPTQSAKGTGKEHAPKQSSLAD